MVKPFTLVAKPLLLVAYSAKFKSKNLNAKYQSRICQDGLKLQNTAIRHYPTIAFYCIFFSYKNQTQGSKTQHFRTRILQHTRTEVCHGFKI